MSIAVRFNQKFPFLIAIRDNLTGILFAICFQREDNPRAMTARATAYDSIVSLPKLNVNVEEGEEIKVVHFGVV